MPKSLIENLFTPYLTLDAPVDDAPLHCWRPYFSGQRINNLSEEREISYAGIQRVMPPGFRESLIDEIKNPAYALKHPAELVLEKRSNKWQELTDLVENYPRISLKSKAEVLGALQSLGFFELAANLHPDFPTGEAIANNYFSGAIAGTLAAVHLILALEGNGVYTLKEFELIAAHAPHGSRFRFDAMLNLVVQAGKKLQNLTLARHWRAQTEQELAAICAVYGTDSFRANLFTSRFYRGVSYVPFLANDRQQVVEEMQLCEDFGARMRPTNRIEEIMCKENWIPLLQSRAKEAKWLGDLPLARERLERACRIDPSESLRWIELGEVLLEEGSLQRAAECYIRATALSPPGTALAWFMAGECKRLAGEPETAAVYYQYAINADPLSLSALEQLRDVSRQLGKAELTCLADAMLAELAQH